MRTLSASALALLVTVPFSIPGTTRAQSYAPPNGQPAQAPAPIDDPYYAMPAPPAYQYDPNQGYDTHVPPGEDGIGYDDAGAEAMAQANAQQASYVDDGYDADAYVDFQASLSPYGQWNTVPEYGNVWTPSVAMVGMDFSPYATGGHWVLTEYGWTWVSDYDWGWAPFHYGRWAVAGSYGWCWIPGRVWGPAWVSWRYGGGYAGWAPLPPRGVTIAPPPIGPGVTGVTHNAWHFTTASGLSATHPTLVSAAAAHAVWSTTTPLSNVQTVNRYHVEAGPAPHLIATATGHSVTPTSVHAFAVAAPRSTVIPRVAPAASAMHPGAQVTMSPRSVPGFAHPLGAPRPAMGALYNNHPSMGAPGANSFNNGMAHGPAAGSPGSYRGPGYGAPAYSAPGYSAPAYHAPAYSAPAYRAPSYGGGSYSAPAYQRPAYSPPAYHPPVYSPPAYHAPSYSAPSYSAPSYHSAPSYSAPSYHSAPSYSAPSYSAPSYHSAPSYSAPSYHAPSYSAPSYSAPRGGGGFHFGGGRR